MGCGETGSVQRALELVGEREKQPREKQSLSHEKEGNPALYDNMAGPRKHYAK